MKSRIIKLLNIVTVAAAVGVAVYYTVFIILCLLGYDSAFMLFFALFIIACVILPIILHERLKGRLKKVYKTLKVIYSVLLVFYVISLAAFWVFIGLDSVKNSEGYAAAASTSGDTGSGTVIMVFGCHTNGYTPSTTLRLRLDEAHKLLSALPDSICIVSGGQGSNETVAEAVAMKAYLIDRGIDEKRIYTEDSSHSTSENIRFTKQKLAEHGIEPRKIIGVSTAFHLPRIEMLANRYDLPMEVCASPSPNFALYYVSMVREYLSYIKMILFDNVLFA
jgi:uncharacterized SAM-binding protein YcdF (DUF218 family)